MMRPLSLAVAADSSLPLDSPQVLSAVDDAAARQASAWTEPRFVRTSDGTDIGLKLDGAVVHHYLCMAEPK